MQGSSDWRQRRATQETTQETSSFGLKTAGWVKVPAARGELGHLREDPSDRRKHHLRRDFSQHVVLPREQAGEEREGVAGIFLGRERRRRAVAATGLKFERQRHV